MTFSVRMNDEDGQLIKKYAEMNNISVSDLIRQAVLDKIEDEYDLDAYSAALAEYGQNPVTHTLDEVERELGFK